MNPDRIDAAHDLLPSVWLANSATAATVFSSVTRVATSSTSGSTGTGLKKCRPSTRCGFSGRGGDLRRSECSRCWEASTAPGSVMIASSSAKSLALTFVLDDRLDDQLPVGEVRREGGGECQPAQRRVAVLGGQLALLHGLVQGGGDPLLCYRPRAPRWAQDDDVNAGLGAHLGDPPPICPPPRRPTRSILLTGTPL